MVTQIRQTGPFNPERIRGASEAIYDVLADGAAHTEADLLLVVARSVPASQGLRRAVRPPKPAPTGQDYHRAVVTGQRMVAKNLVMIAVRNQRAVPVTGDDGCTRYMLTPDVAEAWRKHRAKP